VSEWIKYLPEARQQLPDIKLQYAYSLIPYQEEEAFGLFCDLYEQALNLGNITLAYDAWTGLADCSFYNLNRFGELKDWLVHITQLLKKEPLPTEEKSRNAFVAAYFNALLFCAPDKKKLIEWQSKAHSALNKSTNPETRTLLSNHLILVSIWQGDMFQARLLSKEFLGVDSLQNQNPLAFMVQKTMQSQVAWLNADKAESLNNSITKMLNAIGSIHYKLGNLEEAAKAYEKAIKKEPNNEAGKFALREINDAIAKDKMKNPFKATVKVDLTDTELKNIKRIQTNIVEQITELINTGDFTDFFNT